MSALSFLVLSLKNNNKRVKENRIVSPSEVKEYLNDLIDSQVDISVMIWGAAGIGKSSVVRQIAHSHDLQFVDVRLSQLAPTDLRGLPVPEDGTTYWAPPEFLPKEGRGILFMDEINMAPPAMQGVAQQLILDRRIGNYEVPEGWYIWAAGNRKEDKASVFDMPAPLANRFIHLDVEASIENFRLFAFQQGFNEKLIAFLAFRPDLLHKMSPNETSWPSPRSWEMANRLYNAGLNVQPAIGIGAAAEFYAYIDITDKIPDISAIVLGTKHPSFPEEVSLRYATVMSLVAQCTDPDKTLNAMSWLVDQALPEWVQLFATDAFPLLREKGLMEQVQVSIMKEEKLRSFLTEYAKLMAA